jgi:hypothetical protein
MASAYNKALPYTNFLKKKDQQMAGVEFTDGLRTQCQSYDEI